MEKAYDLQELGRRLKAKGLVQAEELAGDIYVVTKEWLQESAVKSDNKYDDIAAPFLSQLDAVVLPQIDKIDGQVG